MFYLSLQCINNLIIFRIAFSNRFRCIIHTKKCLRGSNKNPVNYFKGHKVATCWHPIPTILQTEKSLQWWIDMKGVTSSYAALQFITLLGLMVYLWTIDSYFQGFLYCWLCQFVKSTAFVAGFEDIPELQEICSTNKLDFLSCCWKAELKADMATAHSVYYPCSLQMTDH